jgi:hypothetical protein
MFIVGYALLFFAILVVALNEAAVHGRIGTNPFMGLRRGAVSVSKETRRVGYSAARVPMVLAGAVLAIAGVYALLFPVDQERLSTLWLFVVPPVAVCFFSASMLGDTAARKYLKRNGLDDAVI